MYQFSHLSLITSKNFEKPSSEQLCWNNKPYTVYNTFKPVFLVIFTVFLAARLPIEVVWIVKSCGHAGVYQGFGITCSLQDKEKCERFPSDKIL